MKCKIIKLIKLLLNMKGVSENVQVQQAPDFVNQSQKCDDDDICVEKWIYASEETNRWLRNIESSMWMIASILLGATGLSLLKCLDSYHTNKQYGIERVNVIGVIMLVLWVFFLCFLKDLSLKSQDFVKKSELCEEKLGININQYSKEDKPSRCLNKGYFSSCYRGMLRFIPRVQLMTLMAIISWLMVFFWGGLFTKQLLLPILEKYLM